MFHIISTLDGKVFKSCRSWQKAMVHQTACEQSAMLTILYPNWYPDLVGRQDTFTIVYGD